VPAAIVDGHRHMVVQRNACAAERGIAVGMGLATAASLCRDIRMLPYRREQEVDKLREIARWLYCVSADIALQEPDGLLLRVTPMLRLYGDLPRYWQAVRALLDVLAERAPGRTVEVRVPPHAAVQCVQGPRHTRGTPPNVVEMNPVTWIRLAAGRSTWGAEVAAGRVSASGERADLTAHLPVF
jgi:hypothetical protein